MATCETHGHLWGVGGKCMFCGEERPAFNEDDTWPTATEIAAGMNNRIAALEQQLAEANERADTNLRALNRISPLLAEANARLDALHGAIESFWSKQCGDHACGCESWPECTHTINTHELRKQAMEIDSTAPPAAKEE